MWSLNYGTNEYIYKIVIGSQTQRTDLWLPSQWGKKTEGWTGSFDFVDAKYYIYNR